uniref:Protein involved in initiation of plasmid replication n=1 Tax=Candidatus Kentrum sp. FM TaxID=2126340 RepID=A0A450T6S3_9GAMM|nr:MAG: Protein involved in initiation of plasmid replication [Candidatus Kentron sp. FM]VFJ62957.1 MAG: Protein involved in initiation of plasmid replication [Candidatus Kentron sp. FM]VFK14316.1 MAG: Protein involved in initiation of plasmid replication [Candidatus Kentron sp. FM]
MDSFNEDSLIVTQANKLATASYTLTLEEKRIILLMASLIRRDDEDFKDYVIPIIELQKYLGLRNKNFYERLRDICKKLRSRPVSINQHNGDWLEIGWIDSAEYKSAKNNELGYSCLILSFSPKMKPYLLQLKEQFHSYMLSNVANLKSIYSIRIYEILVSFRRKGKVVLEVDSLRKMLQVEHKYLNFKDFRNRVIIPSQRELQEKSDLCFEFVEIKKGRRVHEVQFIIHEQECPTQTERKSVPLPNQLRIFQETGAEKEQDELYEKNVQRLLDTGVRKKIALQMVKEKEPSHVEENIEYALTLFMRSKKEDKDLASLMIASIRDDYTAEERKKRRKKEEADLKRKKREWKTKESERLKAKKTEKEREKRENRFGSMNSKDKEDLFKAFEESGKLNSFMKKKWSRNNPTYGIAGSIFLLFMDEYLKQKVNKEKKVSCSGIPSYFSNKIKQLS